jgi:hypothetical protein
MTSSLNQEQNKTKKKKSNKHHKNILNNSLKSLLYLSLLLSSLSFQKKTEHFYIREFVLYFERDEKRNKTAFVPIGLLRRNFESV